MDQPVAAHLQLVPVDLSGAGAGPYGPGLTASSSSRTEARAST